MKQLLKHSFYIILVVLSSISYGQNPLKKELRGSSQQVYYSPSQFTFTNYKNQTVLISELIDNRDKNWNKQVNDTIRIELIRDFWNYPYKALFKNKINQDLSKSAIKIDFNPTNDQIVITPTLEAHYPNFISYPKKGYWIYTKVDFKVTKNNAEEFVRSYQDYYFFGKGHPEFKEEYLTDYSEGTNAAMWIGMKHILDRFYGDLNQVFAGTKVSNDNAPLVANSNIQDDKNLNTIQQSYSDAKDKGVNEKKVADNYKMDDPVALPPPTDPNLDKAINTLPKTTEAKTVNPKVTTVKKPSTAVAVAKQVEKPAMSATISDSTKLVERKLKEQLRQKALDSAMKAKELLAQEAKQKLEQNKIKQKELAILERAKKDSILKQTQLLQANKLKSKTATDSIKLTEVNQKIEQAKKNIEARKKTTEKIPSSPAAYASVKKEDPPKKTAPRTQNSNVNMTKEIERIAREVEEEENKKGNKRVEIPQVKTISAQEKKEKLLAEQAEQEKQVSKLKAEREAKLAALKAEREAKLLKETADAKAKEEVRKAKEEAKKQEIAKKAEQKILAQTKPIDPKKLLADSLQMEENKRKKREAILAAQRAAMEAERTQVAKSNTTADGMFELVSSDPPSKLPDTRTPEQRKADRIFTPKNDIAKDLLDRVKLITPEEEMKMLSQLKTSEMSSVDSAFIEFQRNRPIAPPAPKIDSTKSIKTVDSSKSKTLKKGKGSAIKKEITKADIKKAIEEKGLKEIIKKPDSSKVKDTEKKDLKTENTTIEKKADSLNNSIKKEAEALKKKAAQGVK